MEDKKALIEVNVNINKEEYKKVVNKMMKKMFIKPCLFGLILIALGAGLLILGLLNPDFYISLAVGITFLAISVIAYGFIFYSFMVAKKKNNLDYIETEYKLYPSTFTIHQKTNKNEIDRKYAYDSLIDLRHDEEFVYIYLNKNNFIFLRNNEDGQKVYEFIKKKMTK